MQGLITTTITILLRYYYYYYCTDRKCHRRLCEKRTKRKNETVRIYITYMCVCITVYTYTYMHIECFILMKMVVYLKKHSELKCFSGYTTIEKCFRSKPSSSSRRTHNNNVIMALRYFFKANFSFFFSYWLQKFDFTRIKLILIKTLKYFTFCVRICQRKI